MSMPNPNARPRRWWQFGLRTLLVAMVLLAVGLGYWCDRARRLRGTLTAVDSLDVDVYWGAETGGKVGELPIFQSLDPPAGWAWLGPEYTHSPTSVAIGFGASLEQVVPHLKTLPRLRAIYVMSNGTVARSAFQEMHGVELFAIRRGRCGDMFVESLADSAGSP